MSARIGITAGITAILAASLFVSSCRDATSPLQPKVRSDLIVVIQAFQNVQLAQPADRVLGDADFVIKAITDAPFEISFFAEGSCALVGDGTNSIDPGVFPTAITPDTATITIRITDVGSCTLYASASSGLVGVSDVIYYAFDSAMDVKTFNISSANAAPIVGAVTGPANPQPAGASVSVTASFTDANAADTHTAVIDWADGSQSAAAISESSGAGALTASHTYSTPGVYLVKATVSDNHAASDTTTFSYAVVYDPSAGFVTGGGWITDATFGFVAKYQTGNSAPTGKTEFLFHAGGMNFTSASYDWLVVAGPKAQFKGTGRINGSGSYQFMLTANDGQLNGGGGVDRLRMKIWHAVTGAIVYDNQAGAGDNASATTALGGGSIVIHKN